MTGPGGRFLGSPVRLLLLACSFVITGYAGVRLLSGDWTGILIWFVGAAVLHDLVLLPVYGWIDRALSAVARRRGSVSGPGSRSARPPSSEARINHVRVPLMLSGLLLLVWFPLILRRVDHFERDTALDPDVFLPRWLLITAGLFVASALWFAVSAWRGRGR